jgi:hypothetical protein
MHTITTELMDGGWMEKNLETEELPRAFHQASADVANGTHSVAQGVASAPSDLTDAIGSHGEPLRILGRHAAAGSC